jgi:selenocysteine lyase/cysteine desulfurase
MSPGGFKPFEHQWAVAAAFRFHQEIGKSRVAEQTHALNRQLTPSMINTPEGIDKTLRTISELA